MSTERLLFASEISQADARYRAKFDRYVKNIQKYMNEAAAAPTLPPTGSADADPVAPPPCGRSPGSVDPVDPTGAADVEMSELIEKTMAKFVEYDKIDSFAPFTINQIGTLISSFSELEKQWGKIASKN